MAVSLDDLYALEQVNGSAVRDVLVRIERLMEAQATGGPGPLPTPVPQSPTFMNGLTTGPAKILGMFAALEKGLVSFGAQIGKFVAQASPAHMLRWNLAVADLNAVIGRALLPTMEKVTAMVRKLADTFASLSPEAQKLAAGLGVGAGLGGTIGALITAGSALIKVVGGLPVLIGTLIGAFVGVASTMRGGQSIIAAFGSLSSALASLVEVVTLAVVPILEHVLVPVLEEIADAAKDAAAGLKTVVGALRDVLGLAPLEQKSSVGAAVRGAQIGDVQSYANRAYTSALQGGVNNVEKEQLTELKGIHRVLREIRPWTPKESPLSVREWTERQDKNMGGSGNVGRAAGSFIDRTTGMVTLPWRYAITSMRELFG